MNILTQARRDAFLEALARVGVVNEAARAAGVHRVTAYKWREADEAFAADWDDALEQCADRIEAEAMRRAVDGVEEPVYQGGQLVGTKLVYSDTLLGKLLNANRPAKYRERFDVAHSGNLSVVVVTGVPDAGEDLT